MGNDSLAEGGENQTCPDPWAEVNLNHVNFIAPIVVLIVFNLCVIGGNILVIVAVFTHSKLRSVTNKFIVSLAVADLMLGVAVLPFSSANEVLRYWPFGSIWCSMWLAVDVWLSTASILNLCAISFDRYLAISRPFKYPTLMSPLRGKILIVAVWMVSFVICFPPLIGWNERGKGLTDHHGRDGSINQSGEALVNVSDIILTNVHAWSARNATTIAYRVLNQTEVRARLDSGPAMCSGLPECMLTSDPGYIVYSALGSFWIPAVIMCLFYWRIYRTASTATSNIRRGVMTTKTGELSSSAETSVTLRIHRGRYGGDSVYNRPSMNSYEETTAGSIGLLSAESTPKSKRKVSETSLGGAFNKNLPSISEERAMKSRHKGSRFGKGESGLKVKKKKKKPPKVKVTFTKIPKSEPCNVHLLNERTSASSPAETNGGRQTKVQQNGTNLPYVEVEDSKTMMESDYGESRHSSLLNKVGKVHIKTHLKRLNREKKAAKTVGIIVGCFIICWLPFFSVYLLGAFCSECTPPLVFTIFFWLGYCNSAINPCLYALCSKDFRYAFKKLLRCRWERTRLQPQRGRGTNRLMTFIHSLRIQISSKESDSNSE